MGWINDLDTPTALKLGVLMRVQLHCTDLAAGRCYNLLELIDKRPQLKRHGVKMGYNLLRDTLRRFQSGLAATFNDIERLADYTECIEELTKNRVEMLRLSVLSTLRDHNAPDPELLAEGETAMMVIAVAEDVWKSGFTRHYRRMTGRDAAADYRFLNPKAMSNAAGTLLHHLYAAQGLKNVKIDCDTATADFFAAMYRDLLSGEMVIDAVSDSINEEYGRESENEQ